MELELLVNRNFKFRDDVEANAHKIIDDELKKVPLEGIVKAVITDQGNSFLISVVAKTNNKIFSSESHHQKELLRGKERHWQVGALKLVLSEVLNQIKKAFHMK